MFVLFSGTQIVSSPINNNLVSEAYTESPGATRNAKVIFQLEEMGVSVLSDALSTMIAVFPMFFAPNLFFVKFAAFLFVTIFLSCLYALVFFPAVLAMIGPSGNQGAIYAWFARLIGNRVHEFAKSYIQSKQFIRRERESLVAWKSSSLKENGEEAADDTSNKINKDDEVIDA